MMKKRHNCAACWGRKSSCGQARGNDRCNHCIGKFRTGTLIPQAQPLQISALREHLLRSEAWLDSGTNISSSTVHIRIQTEDNQIFDRDSHYVKNLGDENATLMQTLDDVLRPLFAARLDAKNRDTSYIPNACFVGGYLGVLGRGVFVSVERPQIFINGVAGGSVPSPSIEAHVKYLMLCRIFRLTEDILIATRTTDNDQSAVAYAAAVVLDFELRSFQSFASTEAFTALQTSINDTQNLLLNWIYDVRRELQSRIYEGCRRYTPWNSVVAGSLKTLQEGHHTKRRAWISISEPQSFIPTIQTNPWPYQTVQTYATDHVSSWQDPTVSLEYYASQSSAYLGQSDNVSSLRGPSSSAYMAVPETYTLPTSFENHSQFGTTISSPFTTGNDLISNSGYAARPDYMAPPVESWTSNFVPGADQRSTYMYSLSTDTSRGSQTSDFALIEDPIKYNPLLHEPRLGGEYPSDVELDD